jgi:ABC-2 type transport system permease protein
VSTIFRYALSRSRGAILGWGIGLFLLGLLLMPLYDTIAQQQEGLLRLVKDYPAEIGALFGDLNKIGTPEGYLNIEFFSYMPLVLGIFAIGAGSGLLAADEEDGRLDLLLAHPISRTSLFFGRLLAFVASSVAILILAWLGLCIPSLSSKLFDLGFGAMLLPFVSLLCELLLFGVLALFLSMILPSRRASSLISGAVLVGSFFITGLSRLNDTLEAAARFSPLTYYQGGEAVKGLNMAWLAGLLGSAVVFIVLAWWRFRRRDIRVSGESGWQLRDMLHIPRPRGA